MRDGREGGRESCDNPRLYHRKLGPSRHNPRLYDGKLRLYHANPWPSGLRKRLYDVSPPLYRDSLRLSDAYVPS